jgi:adenylate kinase
LEESLLSLGNIKQSTFDLLTINLKTEPVAINDLEFQWVAEQGIISNLSNLINDFKINRGLTSMQFCVMGPPAAGKTTLSKSISQYYNIHHVLIKDAISEYLQQNISDDNFYEIKEAIDSSKRLNDDQIVDVLKWKLNTWQCKNQGYVLDNLPKNIVQANKLFQKTEESSGRSLLPQYLIVIESTTEFLKERVINMSEDQIIGTHNNEQGFTRRIKLFLDQKNDVDRSVISFFEQNEQILPIVVEADETNDKILNDIVKIVGNPHNYGPSLQEIETKRKLEEEQELKRKKTEEEIVRQQELHEKLEREKREQDWKERISKLEQEEKEALEIQSAPFRTYLMSNIMPTLTAGLIELCQTRPSDPIDYLVIKYSLIYNNLVFFYRRNICLDILRINLIVN